MCACIALHEYLLLMCFCAIDLCAWVFACCVCLKALSKFPIIIITFVVLFFVVVVRGVYLSVSLLLSLSS